jgi:transcriptional regulator with XRE-family HTH domain
MKTQPNQDTSWLRRMAEVEDNAELSVGGLAHELGMLGAATAAPTPVVKSAFAKLVGLRRRDMRLTVEQLAERAEVDVAEVVSIELGQLDQPEPRTVFKLAGALKLPAQKLMQVSGLAVPRDTRFNDAVVRFAARSEPIEKLSKEEHAALEEFVRFLAES